MTSLAANFLRNQPFSNLGCEKLPSVVVSHSAPSPPPEPQRRGDGNGSRPPAAVSVPVGLGWMPRRRGGFLPADPADGRPPVSACNVCSAGAVAQEDRSRAAGPEERANRLDPAVNWPGSLAR